MPVAGSALAHTRYQTRERSALPTTTRAAPLSSAMPSAVKTSAKPSPEAASRREITVCAPSCGSVGQINASTLRALGSFASLAPSISA